MDYRAGLTVFMSDSGGFSLLVLLPSLRFDRSESIEDSLDDHIVESFLVAGEVCRMESGGDDAVTVKYGLTVAEVVATAQFLIAFHLLAPLGIVGQHLLVGEHEFPYIIGYGVLLGEWIGNQFF